ncbi:MAG: glycosyltransferase [Actinobacteria bacterium]|nr:glycosyltransferase [Actinomycetota bacterium]
MHVASPVLTSSRIGLVSTYPPTLCGLATFASALGRALAAQGHQVEVVRLRGDHGGNPGDPPVVASIHEADPASLAAAADQLSQCDTVIVQHEYGIYGGADGAEVIDLLDAITAPTIVVLHTVPLHPTPHQHQLLGDIADRADRLVVMSTTAHDRLCELYRVDPRDVDVIPHGAATPRGGPPMEVAPQLLTWGLLGPGKGLEHAIGAVAVLARERVRPRYTISGVTHPNVFAREGNRYHNTLVRQVAAGGVGSTVHFDDRYRTTEQLTEYIATAHAVILPYDSQDQVTSGVLVDALAAGRPVIATAFPHALELLSSGAGLVVPHRNPIALATAMRSVVLDRDLAASMAAEARRIAPSLSWPAVAASYAELGRTLHARTGAARA